MTDFDQSEETQDQLFFVELFVRGISLFVWSIFGLYIWIPLMLVCLVSITLGTILAASAGARFDIPKKEVRKIAHYYFDGFDAICNPQDRPEPDDNMSKDFEEGLSKFAIATGLWFVIIVTIWIIRFIASSSL